MRSKLDQSFRERVIQDSLRFLEARTRGKQSTECALCACRIMRAYSSIVVLRRDVFISCVESHGVGIRSLYLPLFISLLSLFISFYACPPLWLLLTYFCPSLSRRGTTRYIPDALHEHAWSRTVTHDLSRTHAGRYTCHTSRRIPREGRGERKKGLFSSLERLISFRRNESPRDFCSRYDDAYGADGSMTNRAI